jgi:hypothetical protein
MSPVHVGLVVDLTVTQERLLINIPDTDRITKGKEPFVLDIPRGGLELKLSSLFSLMETTLNVPKATLPDQIRNLGDNTSLILSSLKFKLPEWEYDTKQNKWTEPKKVKNGDGKEVDQAAEYAIMFTLRFDREEHGGLLTSLIGVDMRSVLDINSLTLSLTTDYFLNKGSELKGLPTVPPPPSPPPTEGPKQQIDRPGQS